MKISPVSYQSYQRKNNLQTSVSDGCKCQTSLRKNAGIKNSLQTKPVFKGDGGAIKGIVGGGLIGAAAAGAVILAGGLAALAAAGVTTAAALGCGAGLGAQIGGIIGGIKDDSSIEDLEDQIGDAIKKVKDKVGIK